MVLVCIYIFDDACIYIYMLRSAKEVCDVYMYVYIYILRLPDREPHAGGVIGVDAEVEGLVVDVGEGAAEVEGGEGLDEGVLYMCVYIRGGRY